jgi:high-affinity iron transporter
VEFSGSAFLQSFTIIAREGLEVVLILGAMLAVLRKDGSMPHAAGLWWGTALAVLASLATAALATALFRSAEQVEVLEGVTMLAATGVLFYVGHWLLAKVDVARWQAYIKRQVRSAAGRGSIWALGAVAFVAVYREGVETVLFYRALISSEPTAGGPVLVGLALGIVGLAILCYAIYRFGLRIPLRPFFAVTSAFLLFLAFVFAGKGLHELQEGGVFPETSIGFPRLPPLGIYPTVETLAMQAVVLVAIFVPLFLRRIRRRPVLGLAQNNPPTAATAMAAAALAGSPASGTLAGAPGSGLPSRSQTSSTD